VAQASRRVAIPRNIISKNNEDPEEASRRVNMPTQSLIFDPESWIHSCNSLGLTSKGGLGGLYQSDPEAFMQLCHKTYLGLNFSTKKWYVRVPDKFKVAVHAEAYRRSLSH